MWNVVPKHTLAWLFLVAGAAQAATPGFYVGGSVGAGYAPNQSLGEGVLDFDAALPSYAFVVGRWLEQGWRVEVEASYAETDIEIFPQGRGVDIETTAKDLVATRGLAVNFLYEFAAGRPLRPYLGMGVGADQFDYHLTNNATGQVLLNDAATVATARFVAGVEWDLWRNFDLSADYRFRQSGTVAVVDSEGRTYRINHALHLVALGLNYRIGETREAQSWRRGPTIPTGYYVSVTSGATFPHDNDVSHEKVNLDAFDIGPFLALSIGRRWTSGVKFEIEVGHFDNDVDVVDFGGVPVGELVASGRVKAESLMANFIYEMPFVVVPYIGVGVGAARVDYHLDKPVSFPLDDRDDTVAIQVFAGLTAPVTQRLNLRAEVRGWVAPLVKLDGPDDMRLEMFHGIYAVGVGLSYRFD